MKKMTQFAAGVLSILLLCSTGSAAAVSGKTVTLGGQPFGVKFYNDGVIIIALEEFYSNGRYVCPAKDGGLRKNDVIKRANGVEINSNEDLQDAALHCEGKRLNLVIERDGKELSKSIQPEKNTVGSYLLGVWVRDSCAGIGTVTYYDAEEGYFAALGHGICDRDTGALLPLGEAEVVSASVSSVTKSSAGKAGSLNGYFTDKTLGSLTKNTPSGVFGTTIDNFQFSGQEMDVADFGEIEVGEAQVYTAIDGEETGCYNVEITKICNDDVTNNENFVIKVTDERIVRECGGIVQGMSGSPIVQNGKLVGAITHVFLNNPTEGYGVAAQFMVSNYQN